MNQDILVLKQFARSQALRSLYFTDEFLSYILNRKVPKKLTDEQKSKIECLYAHVINFRLRLLARYLPEDKKALKKYRDYFFSIKLRKECDNFISYQQTSNVYDIKENIVITSRFIDACVDILNLLNNPEHYAKNDIPDEQVWITKVGDDSHYCGKKMKLVKTSLYYKIFSIIFDHLGKMGGAISYGDIIKFSKNKIPKLHTTKGRSKEAIVKKIRNALTGAQNGFYRASKINKKECEVLITDKIESLIVFNNRR
jgi:hypothetical protein